MDEQRSDVPERRGGGRFDAGGQAGCGAAGVAGQAPVALGETDEVLDTACRMLLRNGSPVAIADLASELGEDPAAVAALVGGYERRGRLKRDGGSVVAAAGLSAVPSDFEIQFGGQRMWAWCARSALGIVSALGAGGRVESRSPLTGSALTIALDESGAHGAELAVFWPADAFRGSCGPAAAEHCPAFALLENADAARIWAQRNGFPGEVLTVSEATSRAAAYYRPILGMDDSGSALAAAGYGPA